MEFKKVFRGYDPQEVDRHLVETANKEQQIRASQKERIDELLDENRVLRNRVEQYKADEKAISQSLITAQNMAREVKIEADEYAKSVLNRAKVFYASWRVYSKMIVASLSDEEVREFNYLQRQIENLLNSYDGKKEVGAEVAAAEASALSNPIARVEQASEQVIDLKELISTNLSLEEICAELGIVEK